MITGVVNANLEAVVQLKVRKPGGVETEIEAIIDSGFSSSLSLPLVVVKTLGLLRLSSGTAKLADGTTYPIDHWAAEVEWGGSWRPVLVSGIGEDPLLGMHLLTGHKLEIDVAPGGWLEIVPLP